MDRAGFQEALLSIMERKVHWAWPAFTSGSVARERLHVHLENEFGTYVRDFPILVARAYVQCPIATVRRELIENVYEEETGGISAGRPHPELFLLIPEALNMDLARFSEVTLLPEARMYRATLDNLTMNRGWATAAAVSTLFLEGTPYERGELDDGAPRRPTSSLDEHPLVRHYGLPVSALALTRAHRTIEGNHRAAAWSIILDHIDAADRLEVVTHMETCLKSWLHYRDGVAKACGVERT